MKGVFGLTFFAIALTIGIVSCNAHASGELVINEFLPKPSTNNPEWIEFYNPTDSTIDLSDYYFDDDADFNSDSGTSAKIALSGVLEGKKDCFWELPSYLNNNGDSPSLFKVGQNLAVDTYTYGTADTDISYSRVPDGGEWQSKQAPTKSSTKCQDLAPIFSPSPQSSASLQNSPSSSTKVTSVPTPSTSTKTVLGTNTTTLTPSPVNNLESTPSSVPTETPLPSPEIKASDDEPIPKIAGILIGSSFVMFALSLGLYLWYRKKFIKTSK